MVVCGGMVVISLLSGRKGDLGAGLIGGIAGAIVAVIAVVVEMLLHRLGRSRPSTLCEETKDEFD